MERDMLALNTDSPSIDSAQSEPPTVQETLANNPAVLRALRRLQESQAAGNHMSHWTKHSSHSVKHASFW